MGVKLLQLSHLLNCFAMSDLEICIYKNFYLKCLFSHNLMLILTVLKLLSPEPLLLGLPNSIPHKPLFLESCLQQFSLWNKETTIKAASSQPRNKDMEESKGNLGRDVLDLLAEPSNRQTYLSGRWCIFGQGIICSS